MITNISIKPAEIEIEPRNKYYDETQVLTPLLADSKKSLEQTPEVDYPKDRDESLDDDDSEQSSVCMTSDIAKNFPQAHCLEMSEIPN